MEDTRESVRRQCSRSARVSLGLHFLLPCVVFVSSFTKAVVMKMIIIETNEELFYGSLVFLISATIFSAMRNLCCRVFCCTLCYSFRSLCQCCSLPFPLMTHFFVFVVVFQHLSWSCGIESWRNLSSRWTSTSSVSVTVMIQWRPSLWFSLCLSSTGWCFVTSSTFYRWAPFWKKKVCSKFALLWR